MDERIEFLREELARVKRERDESIEAEKKTHRALLAAVGCAERFRGMIEMVRATVDTNAEGVDTEALNTEINDAIETLNAAYRIAGVAIEE